MKYLRVEHIIATGSRRAFLLVAALALLPAIAAGQVPAAPSNVVLTIVRDNAIDVSWQDNSNNEAAFDIYRRSGAGTYSPLAAVDANITLFQDRNSGIRPNVQFCYQVAARNGFGSSPKSTESCVTVPPRPNAPSNLQLSRETDESPLVLSWTDNSSNEANFLIYRNTEGPAYVLYDTVAANTTTYSDLLLRTAGNYCYFVSAINQAGESPGTDPTCLEIATGLPVPPTGTSAETESDSSIRVSWSFGVINFGTLFLERSDDGQTTWTDVFQSTDIVEQHTDEGLVPNTEYCYRVRVENASNVPSYSSAICTVTQYAVPSVPEGVGVLGHEGHSVTVSWDSVVSANILYRIERQAGDGPFELSADSVEATSITDAGLDADTVYCYRVLAFNPKFESEFSAPVCGIVAPDPVASLSAVPDPAEQTSQAVVTWQQGTDVSATYFLISYREAGTGSFSDPIAVFGTDTTLVGLSDVTQYDVAVQSVRVIGQTSSQSSTVTTSVRTYLSFWPGDVNGDGQVTAADVVSLTTPECFGASTDFSTSGQNVSWAEIPVDVGDQSPTVLRCDTDRSGLIDIFDFLAIAANAGRTTGKSEQVASTLIVDDAHLARIASIYDSFDPAEGNAAQAKLKEDLGQILDSYRHELPDEVALQDAYPNPASTQFSATVELPAASNVSTLLVNAVGQTVGRIARRTVPAGRQTLRFDVANLAPGLYFLVVETGGKRFTKSITVVR